MAEQPAPLLVRKRSLVIAGHATSVSLEEPFWQGLKDMANDRRCSVSALVRQIDSASPGGNLSSALRLAVLAYYRDRHEPPALTPIAPTG